MAHDGLEDFDNDLALSLLKRVQPFLSNLITRLEYDHTHAKSVFDSRYWRNAITTVKDLETDIDLYLKSDPEEEDEG